MYFRFDKGLRDFREKFFGSLVTAAEGPAWKNGDEKRIELLMCGGDEMKIVVPAWQGLWLAREFYTQAAPLKFRWQTTDGENEKKLEFAGALIFAHHKAPIHGLTDLAEKLLEEAKRDRSEGKLSFLVLESFDHVGENLEFFRRNQTPNEEALARVSVSAAKLGELIDAIGKLRAGEFPRRKTYQVLSDLRYAKDEAEETMSMARRNLDTKERQAWDDLVSVCGHKDAAWYHLAELWDYVPVDGGGANAAT